MFSSHFTFLEETQENICDKKLQLLFAVYKSQLILLNNVS